MGLFEEVALNVKSVWKLTSKKALGLVDVSKLRINAAEQSSKISKKLEHLGRVVYNDRKNQEQSDTTQLLTELDELYAKFEKVQEKIAGVQHKAKCPQCKYPNASHAIYCNECGAKMEDEEEDVPEEQSESL